MSDPWEYKTIDFKQTSKWSGAVKVEPLEAQLNELGRLGWELVSTVASHHAMGLGLMLILKRRR